MTSLIYSLCFCRRRDGGFGRSVMSVGGGSVGCVFWRPTVRLTSLRTQSRTRHPPRLRPAAQPPLYAAQSAARGSPQPPASTATSAHSTPLGPGPEPDGPKLCWAELDEETRPSEGTKKIKLKLSRTKPDLAHRWDLKAKPVSTWDQIRTIEDKIIKSLNSLLDSDVTFNTVRWSSNKQQKSKTTNGTVTSQQGMTHF